MSEYRLQYIRSYDSTGLVSIPSRICFSKVVNQASHRLQSGPAGSQTEDDRHFQLETPEIYIPFLSWSQQIIKCPHLGPSLLSYLQRYNRHQSGFSMIMSTFMTFIIGLGSGLDILGSELSNWKVSAFSNYIRIRIID